MNNTLEHIKNKYNLSYSVPMPIILNKVGRHSGLKELFVELGFKTGAEIGTRRGDFAKELCRSIPGLKLYCIDPWKVYPEYPEDDFNQKQMDELYKTTIAKLHPYHCKIFREESMQAINRFTPNSLDFVFIDGNHEYKFVMDDITAWIEIVRPGGIIYGHDYTTDHPGVIQAVNEYISVNNISPWFIPRVGGTVVDCWMFVKPI